MPTPEPSTVSDLPSVTAGAPVTNCSRLAVRVVTRLGEMLNTSARLASGSSAATGSMADSARTDT